MDYEEKYKAVLERAKECLKDGTITTITRDYIWEIFPELKENKNEKIRKDILCYFEHYAHDIKGADVQKWIAWLKEQKTEEVKEVVFSPTIGCDIDSAARQAIKKQRVSGKDIVLVFNGAYISVGGKTVDDIVNEYCSWIKKQGEQTRDELSRSEVTSNQKLESKFKVGDWVVSNSNGEVWQIGAQYTEKGQRIYLYNANDVIMSITLDELNNDYHLWTIRDAKDGDVLASKDEIEILIFRNLDTSTSFSSYYNITGRGDFGWSNICFIPATKEQRNLLFAKIKEIGYEWDTEEKELKKIEQNSTDKIEPKFHEGDYIVPNDITFPETWRVINIDKDGYYNIRCITNPEYDEIYRIPGFVLEKDYHLWTITDAKDGDVLVVDDEYIVSFNDDNGSIGKGINLMITNFHYDFENDFYACGTRLYYSTVYPATKEQRDLLFEKMKKAGYKWDSVKKELEMIEQNPVDKIKPKFNKGEWIIHQGTENIYQVVACVDNQYQLKYGDNYTVQKCTDVDRCARLWTIADAKDGDILVDKYNNVGIYKEIGAVYWDSYIYLGCDGVIRGFSIGGRHEQTGTHPATKEQCDLLFQKMKEAGWERIVKIKN